MSVSNGQTANATTFNNALASKSAANTFTGVQTLNETASAASGSQVANAQRLLNALVSTIGGVAVGSAYNFTITWASDIVGAALDTVKARVEALVTKFQATSGAGGHTHAGSAGEGPKIEGTNIASTGVTSYKTLKANTANAAIWVDDGATMERTSFSIANNQAVAANVTGLVVSSSTYKSALIKVSMRRATASSENVAVGWLSLRYNALATSWSIDEQFFGDDVGMTFTITSGGQVQYTSTNQAGASYVGTMQFGGDLFT